MGGGGGWLKVSQPGSPGSFPQSLVLGDGGSEEVRFWKGKYENTTFGCLK